MRFHTSEVTKASPFFLLYNRDVVLPLDTILKPRRRYVGEDLHKIALEQQHKSFVLVHRYLKQAKKKQKRLADKNSREEDFKVGDPVYVRNHRRTSKLDNKWTPYYRITEQTGPVSFKVRNQLTGEVTKTHARHLRLANVDQWALPKENMGRPLRKSTYVVPPEESSSDESEDDLPLERVIKRTRKERLDSDDEDDIPLTELRQRLMTRELAARTQDTESDDEDVPLTQLRQTLGRDNETIAKDKSDNDTSNSENGAIDDDMEIDVIKKVECNLPSHKVQSIGRKRLATPKGSVHSKSTIKKMLKLCLDL